MNTFVVCTTLNQPQISGSSRTFFGGTFTSAVLLGRREAALAELQTKLLQHKEVDAKVRQLREVVAVSKKEWDKTEDDLKALQSVGQIIGEVLRQLDAERCANPLFLSPSPTNWRSQSFAQSFALIRNTP